MTTVQSSTMINRAIRAAKLEPAVYEEAEHNPALMNESLTVMALSSALAGLGAFLYLLMISGGAFVGAAVQVLIFAVVLNLIQFFVWAALTWQVGTRAFGGTADYPEMVRTLGYAYGPRALSLFMFIPLLGPLAILVGAIWSAVASYIAIRQALDFDNRKAILTVLISFVIAFLIKFMLSNIIGLGPMVGF